MSVDPFDFAAYADRLMAAGDRLAEQLANPRSWVDSPWTMQILDEWREAKDVRGYLPEPPPADGDPQEPAA